MKRHSQQKIREREREVQELRQAIMSLTVSRHQKQAHVYTDVLCWCFRRVFAPDGVRHLFANTTFMEPLLHKSSYSLFIFCPSFDHRPSSLHSTQRSTRTAIEESDKVFTELIRSIELKRFEVRELMGVQERTAVRQAKELLARLEKETNELKRRDAELEKLSDTEDHVRFLQVSSPLLLDDRILIVDPAMAYVRATTFYYTLYSYRITQSYAGPARGISELSACLGPPIVCWTLYIYICIFFNFANQKHIYFNVKVCTQN